MKNFFNRRKTVKVMKEIIQSIVVKKKLITLFKKKKVKNLIKKLKNSKKRKNWKTLMMSWSSTP